MANLKEIAEKAGVSMITVSRVINSPEKVKPETRERIKNIIKKLNYSPNFAAKALASNKTRIIDVYIPEHIDLSNPFVMHFISGISEALCKEMYSFLILRKRENEHACDGYIATGLLKDEIKKMYKYTNNHGCPLVLFGHTKLEDIDCIDVDNVTGAEDITSYLLSKGHRNIAMINVDEDKDYTVDRFMGYKRALKKYGIEHEKNNVLFSKNNVQGGYNIAKRLIKENSVTGIFCATDTIALGAVRAITEAGLRVPEDISIVGFDGLGHHLLTNPHITTVRQPVFKIGNMLAEILLQRINGCEGNEQQLVKPELVINQSVCEV